MLPSLSVTFYSSFTEKYYLLLEIGFSFCVCILQENCLYAEIIEHKYSKIGHMQVSKQYGEQVPPTLIVRGQVEEIVD